MWRALTSSRLNTIRDGASLNTSDSRSASGFMLSVGRRAWVTSSGLGRAELMICTRGSSMPTGFRLTDDLVTVFAEASKEVGVKVGVPILLSLLSVAAALA